MRTLREHGRFLLLLVLAALVFITRFASLSAGGDDIGWLLGEIPTAFDHYRYLPRLIFRLLAAVTGPDPLAALIVIGVLHIANVVLVLHWGMVLTENGLAARAAATVFAINPLTLGTLTWISCLSYVLGCSLMLVTLLAFRYSCLVEAGRRGLWNGITLVLFALTLLSCHDAFFLPLLFPLIGIESRGRAQRRWWPMLAAGLCVAYIANAAVYRLTDQGIRPAKMFSVQFLAAYVSMLLSSGAGLAASYFFSFFHPPADLLKACLAEPGRWLLTLAAAGSGAYFWRPGVTAAKVAGLAAAFAVLITPYVFRLYLMPDAASYHISYVLSGRVFYLPFTALSLLLGLLLDRMWKMKLGRIVLTVFAVSGYLTALFIVYGPADFGGLMVAPAGYKPVETTWTPFGASSPVWGFAALTIAGMLIAVRAGVHYRTTGREAS